MPRTAQIAQENKGNRQRLSGDDEESWPVGSALIVWLS